MHKRVQCVVNVRRIVRIQKLHPVRPVPSGSTRTQGRPFARNVRPGSTPARARVRARTVPRTRTQTEERAHASRFALPGSTGHVKAIHPGGQMPWGTRVQRTGIIYMLV